MFPSNQGAFGQQVNSSEEMLLLFFFCYIVPAENKSSHDISTRMLNLL